MADIPSNFCGVSRGELAVLEQLFKTGPTFDGDIIGKQARDQIIKKGWAERDDGWTYLTRDGVRHCVDIGIARV